MIEWTKQAVLQLEQARSHIALAKDEEVADRITLQILNHVDQLDRFPISGRQGRVSHTRELVIAGTAFIVAYAIDQTRMVILALYHGAQKWPDIL
jgi:plasmid stabilization system protein ParE